MKYFFILGSNPSLSLQEIYQVFQFKKSDIFFLSKDVLVIKTSKKIDAKNKIACLGGTIKIGYIINEIKQSPKNILQNIEPLFTTREGKLKFGFSFYGKNKPNLKALGMETKKLLKEKGQSCRFVTSKEKVLSSVVVEQNKLASNGFEFVVIEKDGKYLLGKTEAVQPFKDLSARDYGRPARDDHSGMLPPKLAMIMLNLAIKDRKKIGNLTVLDPFCGSGTVLQESLVIGFRHTFGSDISKKAVLDSKKNLNWVSKKLNILNHNINIKHLSAIDLSREYKKNSIDCIVTEPYLGPQRGYIEPGKVVKELNELYSKFLREAEKIIKDRGRVVMIWPQLVIGGKNYALHPKLKKLQIVNALPDFLMDNSLIKQTNRKTFVYSRKGQRVWREIVVLEKK